MTKRGHQVELEEPVCQKKQMRGYTQTPKVDETELGDLTRFLTDPKMVEQLKKHGIKSLFPVQQATFHTVVKGFDLTAKDRTGSGKTLAYALPALERLRRNELLKGDSVKILVMLPTRELVIQVRDCFQRLAMEGENIRAVAVYGGDDIRRQLDNLKRGADIIVATPGRLIDFIERGAVKFDQLKCLVLDEADEMLKQGFQDDIQKIFKAVIEEVSPKSKPQTLLFSATIPAWVRNISEKYQEKNCAVVDLVGNTNIVVPKSIKHFKYPIRDVDEIAETVKKLCGSIASKEGRCLIFCETKREVKELYQELKGDRCRMLHGDVQQFERERIYRDFNKGFILKVVATNVAARGLDFPDIELVIQIEPPRQVESYIHRAGRTGRAGKHGTSVVLVQKRDLCRVRTIEQQGGFRFEELNIGMNTGNLGNTGF